MSAQSCLFAVQVARSADLPIVEHRIAALARYFAPVGLTCSWSRSIVPARAIFGAIAGTADAARDLLYWGSTPPPSLLRPEAMLTATDVQLRALDGQVAVIVAGADEVHAIQGAGTGIPILHAAGSERASAWSTHAVAASWLATGGAEMDTDYIPELIAAGYVGGDRCLISGVRVVDPATRIRLTPAGARTSTYWPRAERWAPLPRTQAAASASRALLEVLEHRLVRAPVVLGLTAGLDSRLLAAALVQLGSPFTAMTVGAVDDDDVVGAIRVASALGLEHEVVPISMLNSADHFAAIDADVRWKDGVGRVPLAGAGLAPAIRIGTMVHGGGGELARGFKYRLVARNYRQPGADRLVEVLAPTSRLAGANLTAIERVKGRFGEFVAEAHETGARGWQAAAIVTAEHLFRRIHRTLATMGDGDLVMPFCTPEVQRAFVSLPLEDRLTDGFHRAFLAQHYPSIAPPIGPSQRRGVPRAVRRVAARRRAQQTAAIPPAAAMPAPAVIEWLADQVLMGPMIRGSLGETWGSTTRLRLVRGDPGALELAALAAGPVALEAALAGLRERG